MLNRVLHLTNPHMKGTDVEGSQYLLNQYNKTKPDYMRHFHLTIDGDAGIATLTAAKDAKWWLGYTESEVTLTMGKTLWRYLHGDADITAEMAKRAAKRRAEAKARFLKRARGLEYLNWAVHNEPRIHYAQVRPMDNMNNLQVLPGWDDCSEFATKTYKYAGLPDPNGFNYNGYGNTDTLLQHMREIPKSMIHVLDLVVYGDLPSSHHVAVVKVVQPDPLLVSHGREAGPNEVLQSVEASYQRRNVHWLTLP